MSDSLSGQNGDVARDETARLISSDKVEGTSVHDGAGDAIGSIHSVMIDKQDGRVSYAVLALGGSLVTGANYYPVPWAALTYDTRLGGYVTGMTKAHFEGAPSFESANDWYDRHRNWAGDVNNYYGRPGMLAP